MAHMASLHDELRARGLPAERGKGWHWLEINVEQAQITVEARPHYCNRGRFIVKVFPNDGRVLSIDHQDGFPRYYFGVQACADEIHAWMEARHILPPSQPQASEPTHAQPPEVTG